MIYYSIPWDSSMNIGQYYNKFMEMLPNDDDVGCFLDGDACFTTTYYGRQLEAILAKYPDRGLFAGVTNRVGCRWQLSVEADRLSNDIQYHRDLGAKLSSQYWDTCSEVEFKPDALMSGVLFMLRKSSWKAAGGFPEKGMLGVDNEIHRRVAASGSPLMLMPGMYVYHWYRGGKPDSNKHLKMARRAVYTVITRGYDTLKEPTVVSPEWDYVCFTDDPTLTSRVWQIRLFKTERDQVRAARRRKILPQEFMKEYDLTVWVDGHLGITCDLTNLVSRFHTGPLTVMSHPERDCVYDEAVACTEQGKDDPAVIAKQVSDIRAAGYPRNNGMVATGMLIRDNHDPDLRRFSYAWWSMVETGSRRDQLSFNYVAWRERLNFKTAEWSDVIGTWLSKSKHVKRNQAVLPTKSPGPPQKPESPADVVHAAVTASKAGVKATYEFVQRQVRAKRRAATAIDQLVWAHHDFNYGNSLAHVSRESVRWLQLAGVPVKTYAWTGTPTGLDVPEASQEDLKRAAVIVMDRIPMPQKVWDQLKNTVPFIAAYYMCEGTRVNPQNVARLERYDAVFTPSQFCQRSLIESGLKTPTFVWGHGIDNFIFPYVEPKADRPFTFLWFGDENRRKGYDLFLKAFCELKIPNIRAWVKGPGTGFISELIKYYKDKPNIIFDTGTVPPEQLRTMMSEVDIAVSPHRGEGFGLTVMEAMASGRPAIATRWSGPLDFGGGDDLTYWVDTEGYEPSQHDDGVQAKPDFKKLVTAMVTAALNVEDVRKRGMMAHKHIHASWRWEQKVLEILPILRQLIPQCKL